MISCDFCGKNFKYNYLLEKHLTRKFPCFGRERPGKLIKCAKCDRGFTRKANCEAHEMKCDGRNAMQCGVCLKVFATRQMKHKHKCQETRMAPVIIEGSNITIHSHHTTNNIVINWSTENYEHLTAQEKADVLKRCVDVPVRFFSEFPRVAHQGEHDNLRRTNVRANYVDAFENGKYVKMSTKALLDDCAKKMLYRLDDASAENDEMFKKYERMTKALVMMEGVIDEITNVAMLDAMMESLRVMDLRVKSAKQIIMTELRIGLRNANE